MEKTTMELTLAEVKKVTEALDMLDWECKVTLKPDPGVKAILARFQGLQKEMEKKMVN